MICVRVKMMMMVEDEGPATVSTRLQQDGSNSYFNTTTSTAWDFTGKVVEGVMAAVVVVWGP